MGRKSIAEMEKSSLSTIEEGYENGPLNRKGAALKQKAMIRKQKYRGLGFTIAGLLLITFVFLLLSYEYEPVQGMKAQPIARLLRTGSPRLLHWHWSRQAASTTVEQLQQIS